MANTTKAKLEARIAELERELAAKPKSTLPPRHGEPWYDNDDECLRFIFRRDPTPDLRLSAKTLGRTPYAVFLRAFKLGLTNEDNVYAIWANSTRATRVTTSFNEAYESRTIGMPPALGAPYGRDTKRHLPQTRAQEQAAFDALIAARDARLSAKTGGHRTRGEHSL